MRNGNRSSSRKERETARGPCPRLTREAEDGGAENLAETHSQGSISDHWLRKRRLLGVTRTRKELLLFWNSILGPDRVYSRTPREAREMIAGPLAEMCVSLITTGEVPEDWRLEACDQQDALLFAMYINGLDVNIGGMVSKFADDTKIGGVVDSEEGYLKLEWDLDQMGQWAEEWEMEFKLDKCHMALRYPALWRQGLLLVGAEGVKIVLPVAAEGDEIVFSAVTEGGEFGPYAGVGFSSFSSSCISDIGPVQSHADGDVGGGKLAPNGDMVLAAMEGLKAGR
eukprot:g39873.t1